MRRARLLIPLLFVAANVLGGAACGCNGNPKPTPIEGPIRGQPISSREVISPGTPPPLNAKLTLSGSPFEVTIATIRDKSTYAIELMKEDEILDREVYDDSVDRFRLVMAGGETYEEPIDLLRFPMKIGDSWEWQGKIVANGNPREAMAKVETVEDQQFIAGAPVPAVKVIVTLQFRAVGASDAAKRILTFWFADKKGLFKRQYDSVSIREPAS